jgi:5'-nucleotidase / UDP-sugar diphosphatase
MMPETGSSTITILHTNDIHGRHRPFRVIPGSATSQSGDPGQELHTFEREGEAGGFATLATAVDRIRAERGGDKVLLMDGGDTFSDDLLGNLTEGEANIRLMNQLGYQFMALGNHDFDYGIERTRQLDAIANFPMRAANVIDESTGQPVLGDPTLQLQAGGLRVGMIALGYHNTHQTSSPKNVEGLRFSSGIRAVQRYLPALRQQVDIVVVLSHQGTAMDRVLAREVEGIDVIVGGHSHDEISEEKIGETWIVQAVSDAAVLGDTIITVKNGQVIQVENDLHTLYTDVYSPDTEVAALVTQLRAPHKERLEAVIAQIEEPVGRNYKSESPFERLTGQIMMDYTGADLAFLPGIGYGVTLLPGPMTREMLYTLLPHPAKVVTVELTGAQILDVLEQSATNQSPEDKVEVVGGVIQTAGIRFTMDLNRPVGERISDVWIGGQPIASERTYRLVTNSGFKWGIHRYTTIQQGKNLEELDVQVVDLVENAFSEMGKIRAPKMGEVQLVKEN